MNIGKSKVIRCSRYESVGRMGVRPPFEPWDALGTLKTC